MNGLSIALYFGDIVAKLSAAFGWFAVLFFAVFFVFNFFNLLITNTDQQYTNNPVYLQITQWKLFMVASIMSMLYVITPTKDTIYMIAASEIGETVLITPENKETMSKVRKVVDSELDRIIGTYSKNEGIQNEQ